MASTSDALPVARPLKVLLSAYSCEPGSGSEPGVGWNMARALSRDHDVWLITRENNLPGIREALRQSPNPRLHVLGYDLPQRARWWKRGQRGVRIYYYLWQIAAYFIASRLHKEVNFDVAHHVTFVAYWAPSFISLLPIPFIWGPVGGGESVPLSFWRGFGIRGFLHETARVSGRWICEHDPFLRLTARRSAVALAANSETARRLTRLGAHRIKEVSSIGMSPEEIATLGRYAIRNTLAVRFFTVGRLIHFKAYHLALLAFAQAELPHCELQLFGSGPDRKRLERLSRSLGIANRVHFCGELPRSSLLNSFAECDVLVHPSLHESGGFACLEAMAARRPVICFDLGGPAVHVPAEAGIKVSGSSSAAAVRSMAGAMQALARDPELRARMGEAGRKHVIRHYRWEQRADELRSFYGSPRYPSPGFIAAQ